MTDLGPVQHFLGLRIQRNRTKRQILIHQTKYVDDTLLLFGLQSCNPVAIPLEPSMQLPQMDTSETDIKKLYQRMVGKLMYAMIGTRLDIVFAVATLADFSTAPSAAHLAACKRVTRYLRGTSSHGILYGGSNQSSCIGYTDSDYAGDKNNRKPNLGYVFTLCGSAISWKSQQQKSVFLSSTEAEYVAATEACGELLWLNRLFRDLLILILVGQSLMSSSESSIEQPLPPPTLYIDNQAALSLARNPSYHRRTKHIDVRYHFIRDEVAAGTINLQQIAPKRILQIYALRPYPRPPNSTALEWVLHCYFSSTLLH